MSSLGVVIDDRDGVRRITIDRPEKKNALTAAMYATLAEAVTGAERDAIGAILIGAHGATFSAGNDLNDFLSNPPAGADSPVFRFLLGLAQTDVPIVAAVRGRAIGVGTTMLLHADIVYAAPDALFSVPFIDLGVVPEAGSSVLLSRTIGRARAGAALYLAEPIAAAAAFADGLITKIVADELLDETALDAALRIAAKPCEAVRATKRLVAHDREAIVAAILREGEVFAERLASPETRAIMSAFFARSARV